MFSAGPQLRHQSRVKRAEYAERVVRGGFPGAVARENARRREQFFDSYVGDLIVRDIKQLSEIERTSEMMTLLRLLAARSGQLLVPGKVASEVHYRTKDKVEVDAVLEDRRGRVVAIEVKAASSVRSEDFRGLRHLAERLGDDLLVGIVLYTGDHTVPFGPKLRAMPISALWEALASRSRSSVFPLRAECAEACARRFGDS